MFTKHLLTYVFTLSTLVSCKGEQPAGTGNLKMERKIEMPGVNGRLDHMAINIKDNVLYLAALGNNTIEVIDMNKGIVVRAIKDVKEPQGVLYIPSQNEVVVSSGGNGDCLFFDATTFKVVSRIHLAGDADNIRYDELSRKVYVGYGNGGIAVIDAATHALVGNVTLPGHPESFELDKRNKLILANLPGADAVAVIALNELTVLNTWKITKSGANFPMALDTANDCVMIGLRHPAVLVTYRVKSGREINRTPLVADVDDIFYYPDGQILVASGGGGAINIFKKIGISYKKIADIPTHAGARTSLLIPSLKTYILAEKAEGGKNAAIVVYKLDSIK